MRSTIESDLAAAIHAAHTSLPIGVRSVRAVGIDATIAVGEVARLVVIAEGLIIDGGSTHVVVWPCAAPARVTYHSDIQSAVAAVSAIIARAE